MPASEFSKLERDTLYILHNAQGRQESLKELNEGINPAQNCIFKDVSFDVNSDISDIQEITLILRKYIGIDLNTQTMWNSADQAFKKWRLAIEEKGIFVFKYSFKQEGINGFCLLDNEFPVIYINNKDADYRQIFTLFHELVHILLGIDYIVHENYEAHINQLSEEDKKVEKFCDRLAAEFLFPSNLFKEEIVDNEINDDLYQRLSNKYKVSREVILRRCLDHSLINREQYSAKVTEWKQAYEEKDNKEKAGNMPSGGSYYANQVTYLGLTYLELAFRNYNSGKLSHYELSDYLEIKMNHIPKLEQQLMKTNWG